MIPLVSGAMFDAGPRIVELEGAVPTFLAFALVLMGAAVVIGVGWFLLSQFWGGRS